jgi:hypothetical protein
MSALDPADQFKIPFMIGVVGHRDLVAAEMPSIRAAATDMLRRIRDDNPDVPLRLLCSMAAGADLLVAEAAADLGISIIAVLPYARRLCRDDLDAGKDCATFDRLCDMGDAVELSLPDDAKPGDIEWPGELRDRQLQREDCEALGGTAALQVDRGAYARQSGADDQNIDRLR